VNPWETTPIPSDKSRAQIDPNQPITIDRHNVKIGKFAVGRPETTIWYDPLSGEENFKIHIKEDDTIFDDCDAILEGDHLIITKAISNVIESTPLIKIDLSTINSKIQLSKIQLLITRATMEKCCIIIWYSPSFGAKKTAYRINTWNREEKKAPSNHQNPATPLWSSIPTTYKIGGGVTMGIVLLFLYMYLTKKA
jgi:hypothetical protein